jgi:hypothetical protein
LLPAPDQDDKAMDDLVKGLTEDIYDIKSMVNNSIGKLNEKAEQNREEIFNNIINRDNE